MIVYRHVRDPNEIRVTLIKNLMIKIMIILKQDYLEIKVKYLINQIYFVSNFIKFT